MPLEIATIVQNESLEGDELIERLLDRMDNSEIKALQDKRLIFTRVRTYLEKIFGSFYTSEKKDPLVLIKQALEGLQKNPNSSNREDIVHMIKRLLDNLEENGLLEDNSSKNEEEGSKTISQKLTINLDGEEKIYEIRRLIPGKSQVQQEEKERNIMYRDFIKQIEKCKLTLKQIEGLLGGTFEEPEKIEANDLTKKYLKEIDHLLNNAQAILTGKGIIDDDLIVELKMETLELGEEFKDRPIIDKLVHLESIKWYRYNWANKSFNQPEYLTFFLVSRLINKRAPWSPAGNEELRNALDLLGIDCDLLQQHFIAAAKGSLDPSLKTVGGSRKLEKFQQMITELVELNTSLTRLKTVEDGNNLLIKFLRPGIKTDVSVKNINAIGDEIRSYVKINALDKFMFDLSKNRRIGELVALVRNSLSEGQGEIFQQMQSFRVAHGLSNLKDKKEQEKLSAFISSMDIVQFLTSLSAGQLKLEEVTDRAVKFSLAGTAGESVDPSIRTVRNKGITYTEAASLHNKEFENLTIAYDKPDFEARCEDINQNYEREKDPFIKIKSYAWIARDYPLFKLMLGGCLLLVSPITYYLMLAEKEKEDKTLKESTALFIEKVADLIRFFGSKFESVCKMYQIGQLDMERVKGHYVGDKTTSGKTTNLFGAEDETAAAGYMLKLEEGVHEVFPKIGFELQVLMTQAGESLEEPTEEESMREESHLTDEERAFEEKYGNYLIDENTDLEASLEEQTRKVNTRSVRMLSESLENISVFYERLKNEGYERRIPVMRRDQIISNIRDACYYIRDILKSIDESEETNRLLRKTEHLLEDIRTSIQRVEIIEEAVNVEQENAEVPLYEIHSILLTISSSYIVTLNSLIDLIAQKHMASSTSVAKPEQLNASKKVAKNIDSAIDTLIKNSRSIKLESHKIPLGLRDAMTQNITAIHGEITRLLRSQLIIQNCQHPKDLTIYLNEIARAIIEQKILLPLNNITGALKKAPTTQDDTSKYAIWKPEGEEMMVSSVFGKVDIPTIDLNNVPQVIESVIKVSNAMAEHLKGRGEKMRQVYKEKNQKLPARIIYDDYADRMVTKISGILGQLNSYFDEEQQEDGSVKVSFDPGDLEDFMRIAGTCVGELLGLVKDFNKNKSDFMKEVDALKKIAPTLEGIRNCISDYNQNYMRQKKSADLARSQSNCDKTLISFCQELNKYSDPTSVEHKTLIIRGRVYLALENMVQKILGATKGEFNPEKKKKYQVLVNELFYMMSHVRTDERDLPLFKKFRESALRAAQGCGNARLGAETMKLVKFGEEVNDWVHCAEAKFSAEVVNSCYRPGVDVERLRKMFESI